VSVLPNALQPPPPGVNSNLDETTTRHSFTVGLFGIGLEAYWPQFEGLQPRLTGYIEQIAKRIEKPGVRIVNLGLVNSPEKADAPGIRSFLNQRHCTSGGDLQ
jgi:L-arabinose isomerase